MVDVSVPLILDEKHQKKLERIIGKLEVDKKKNTVGLRKREGETEWLISIQGKKQMKDEIQKLVHVLEPDREDERIGKLRREMK